jgi:hypothetical protein
MGLGSAATVDNLYVAPLHALTHHLHQLYQRHAGVYMAIYGAEPQSDEPTDGSVGQLVWRQRCRDIFDSYYRALTLVHASGHAADYDLYVSSVQKQLLFVYSRITSSVNVAQQ